MHVSPTGMDIRGLLTPAPTTHIMEMDITIRVCEVMADARTLRTGHECTVRSSHRAAGPGAGQFHRRSVRRPSHGGLRRRRRQGRTAARRGRTAPLAAARGRHLTALPRDEPQQALRHAGPAAPGRPRGGPGPDPARRRGAGELPAGHAGALGPRPGAHARGQPVGDPRPHLRLRADRALPRPARLRRRGGGGRRTASPHRRPRPSPDPGGHQPRRLRGRSVRRRRPPWPRSTAGPRPGTGRSWTSPCTRRCTP